MLSFINTVKPRKTRKEELQEAARQNRLSSSQSVLKTHDRGNIGSYGKGSVVSRRKNQAHSKLHSIQAGDSSNRREKAVPKSRLQVLNGDRPNTRVAQANRVDTRNSRRIQPTENPEGMSAFLLLVRRSDGDDIDGDNGSDDDDIDVDDDDIDGDDIDVDDDDIDVDGDDIDVDVDIDGDGDDESGDNDMLNDVE